MVFLISPFGKTDVWYRNIDQIRNTGNKTYIIMTIYTGAVYTANFTSPKDDRPTTRARLDIHCRLEATRRQKDTVSPF